MATIKDKNRSKYPRHTGPLSLYQWKDKVVVAAIGRRGSVQTQHQIVNAHKFKLMQRVFGPSFVFLRLGFAAYPGRPRDRAMKLNYHKAFKGDYPDMELDYTVLQLAEGPLPLPDALSVQATTENTIRLTWNNNQTTQTNPDQTTQTNPDQTIQTNSSQTNQTNPDQTTPDNPPQPNPSDLLMVSLYCPDQRQSIVYPELARRADASAVIVVDPKWSGCPFHLYAACYNKDASLASNSAYLGCFTLQCDNPVPFDAANRYKPRIRDAAKKHPGENFDAVGISGRVGPVNYFTDKRGVVVLRANPAKRSTPLSQAEKMNESRFGLMSHFLSKVREFYTIGFAAHISRTHVRSAAMSANLRRAVVSDGQQLRVDYLAVQLADGPLVPPAPTTICRSQTAVRIRWKPVDNSTAAPDDSLLVAVYNVSRDTAVVRITDAKRREGVARVELPPDWCADHCVAYLAFVNGDQSCCSASVAASIPPSESGQPHPDPTR